MLNFKAILMSALLIVATLGTPAFQNSSGPTLPPSCDQSFTFSGVSTVAKQEVQWVGNQNIFICGIAVSGTAAASVIQLQTGTSTNCKNSNAVALTLASQGTNFTTSLGNVYGMGNVIAPIAAGSNLCVEASASAQGTVSYTQYGPATASAGVPSIYQMTGGVSTQFTSGTTGTLTASFSQTPRAGDLLLAVAFNDDGGDATPPVLVSTPANWLLVGSQLGSGTQQGIFVFSKISNGTENSLTVTFNQTANAGMYNSLYLVEIANAGTVDSTAGNNTTVVPSTTSTATGATITPSTTNELALAIFASNDQESTGASQWGAIAAGWTEGYGQADTVNFSIQELQFRASPSSGVGIAPTVSYTTGGNSGPIVTNFSFTIHHN